MSEAVLMSIHGRHIEKIATLLKYRNWNFPTMFMRTKRKISHLMDHFFGQGKTTVIFITPARLRLNLLLIG